MRLLAMTNLLRRTERSGAAKTWIKLAVMTLACLVVFWASGFGPALSSMFFDETPDLQFLTTRAFRGPFEHIVLERGEVESSSNVRSPLPGFGAGAVSSRREYSGDRSRGNVGRRR